MKIRTRLIAATMAGIIPVWIGISIIITVSIVSDRQKAGTLIEEYTSGVALGSESSVVRLPPCQRLPS